MSSRSSLLKRTLVPLLAAAAAIPFCAPARAATATLNGYGRSGSTVLEFVDCTLDAGSTWYQAVYHAQELSPVVTGNYTTDSGINDTGPGDYNDGAIVYGSFGSRLLQPLGCMQRLWL